MNNSIHIVGVNFKHANLEKVAQVHWPEKSGIGPFLQEVSKAFTIGEIFFLQTCNRREFYFYAPQTDLTREELKSVLLGRVSASIGCSLDGDDFYHYTGLEAVLHLFRVASSLDSMVLGETEIIKQIKDQSLAALSSGIMDRRLKALVEIAIWASKQVRTKTNITRNVVSIASLAYRKVSQHLAGARRKRIVFVGAGDFISGMLPTFVKATDFEILFVNRTRPERLSATYGGPAMTLAEFLAAPPAFDAMITATSSAQPLFDKDWIAKNGGARTLLLDAGLPRDIDAGAGDLSGVTYLDLSQMERILENNRAAREAEIPKTAPIFAKGVEKLKARWLECDLSRFNRQISDHFQETGEKALSLLIKDQLPNLTDGQEEALRGYTQTLVSKLTNIPILGLKGVAKDLGTPAVQAYTSSVAARSNLFRHKAKKS